jgi:hypothetical protein
MRGLAGERIERRANPKQRNDEVWPKDDQDWPKNREAGCSPEEWKDFLRSYSPLDPEPGLGGILSLGLCSANASYFSRKSLIS